MNQFITAVLTSLSSGAIYALMSISLVLVWRSTRVVNFAQAGQAVLTTFIGYEVTVRSGSYWIGLIAAVISGALVGAIIDRFFMRPIFKRVKSGPIVMIAPVVATLGLLGLIQAIIGFIWGFTYVSIEAPVSTDGYNLFGTVVAFSPFNLMVLVAVTIAMLLLTLLFQKTNIGFWDVNTKVNVERCMQLNGRLDGHIVQGHVDTKGVCTSVEDQDGSWKYTFRYNSAMPTVEKGSITVNGTSLTVVDSKETEFSVCIIPYTYENTNFHTLQKDMEVNLEFDIIGKYVNRIRTLGAQ